MARTMSIAGLAVGVVLAGLAMPKLMKAGRYAARKTAGTTFTSGAAGGPRPSADPARGRAA